MTSEATRVTDVPIETAAPRSPGRLDAARPPRLTSESVSQATLFLLVLGRRSIRDERKDIVARGPSCGTVNGEPSRPAVGTAPRSRREQEETTPATTPDERETALE